MLRYLFGRLTGRPKPAQALFERVVAEARLPHWYIAGEVPDTIDGRFAVLATVCALFIVRLESGTAATLARAPALTERFVEAMDAEHRQMGLNDPGLGRRVRKLVALLGRRVGEWRAATAGESEWVATTRSSVYAGEAPSDEAVEHSASALRQLWEQLSANPDAELIEGHS